MEKPKQTFRPTQSLGQNLVTVATVSKIILGKVNLLVDPKN